MEINELEGLLKEAGEKLRTAQEVIYELAHQNQEMTHKLASRDLALKLASSGQLAPVELPEKVAELDEKTNEDLELEEKVADYGASPRHSLHEGGGQSVQSSALSFLES